MDNSIVLQAIRREVDRQGNQYILACHIGIRPQHLSDILSGKRGITDAMAERFGYQRVWRKIK